jgi:hypothetical protein
LILLKNPLFLGIIGTEPKMLKKTSLQNGRRAILFELVESFSGVFNCSLLINSGFSAESALILLKNL